MAATAAQRSDLTIHGIDNLTWFESSPQARRGFCARCGSNLFWDGIGRPYLSICAGTLDTPTGLKLVRHIYAADKGDYYEIGDQVPQSQAFEGYDPRPPHRS